MPLTTPIYETTTFVFEIAADVQAYNEGSSAKYLYSRYDNPTVAAVEGSWPRSTGRGGAAVLVGHGRRRHDAAGGLLKAGDEVVCSAAIYGGTLHLLQPILLAVRRSRRGSSRSRSCASPSRVDRPTHEAGLVRVADQPDAALRRHRAPSPAACRARGVLSVIDNTFASPINQQPLALGVDLAMQSATKYLNGHSDVTGGVLAGPASAARRRSRRRAGCSARPGPACRPTRSAAG